MIHQYEIYSEKYQLFGKLTRVFGDAGVSFHYDKTFYSTSVKEELPEDDLEEIKGHIEELKEYQSQSVNLLNEINTTSSTTSDELPRLRAVAVTATASISTLDNNIEEMNDKISKIEKMTSEINENLDTIKLNNEEEF